MTWDWTIEVSDIAIVIATALGPVLAVQIQKSLERRRSILERRAQIFRVLMATRATMLSPVHVEALNSVPVEFYGPQNKELKAITDAWHSYLDHRSIQGMEQTAWLARRTELFVDMLHRMAQFLRYDFNKSELGKDIYHPTGLVDVETDQEIIRRGFVKLLSGELVLPMAVKEFPVDPRLRGDD